MGMLVFMQVRIVVPAKIGYGLDWHNLRTTAGACIFHLFRVVYYDNLRIIPFYVPELCSFLPFCDAWIILHQLPRTNIVEKKRKSGFESEGSN
jgi:hypothetical protein